MVKNLMCKNRKGLSTIVITVILIALSMAAIVLVWGFVSNLINGQIKSSESCFGNYEKISINEQYTCYEQVSGGYYLRFSLMVGDIDVDKIIVSVSSESAVKSFQITNTASIITGLNMYPTPSADGVILPEKNSGLTYRATTLFSEKIDSIQIAPMIDGDLCDVSDSISQIENCDLLA